MSNSAAIARQLARAGISDVFTFTSKDICQLIAELTANGVHVRHARHEHVAVGMADGYARASGDQIGVAVVGQGVGLTNCLNALITACKARSPILVLVGDVPGFSSRAAQIQRKYVNQRGLLDALEIRHIDLESPASAVNDIQACVDLVRLGGGPLVVNIADEVLMAPAGAAPSTIEVPAHRPQPPSEAGVARVVAMLESPETRNVVILAGRGAVRSGSRDALLELGRLTGAVLGTTLMAKQWFGDSPYSIGIVGGFSPSAAKNLLRKADLVLAFGASLSFDTTFDGAIFGGAPIVQVDCDPAAFTRFDSADVPIVGDARLTAEAIVDAIGGRSSLPSATEGYRASDRASRIIESAAPEPFVDASGPDGLDLRTLMVELDRRLPVDRTVVVDGGHFMSYPILYLSVVDPAGFLWPIEYGAIGCGLGTALGAALARPDRLTVLVVGDGGLMMGLGDLDTAVRYDLPLLVVVCDNAGLVAELLYLVENGYPPTDAAFTNPSFAAAARDLGLRSATVTTIADLAALDGAFAEQHGPMVLDCKVAARRLLPKYTSFARERARRQSSTGASTTEQAPR